MPEWEPRWSEEAGWYVSFSIRGRRFRRRLGIRDKSRKALARRAAKALHEREFEASLRGEVRPSKTFCLAALEYVKRGGEARFLAPIMRYLGPDTLIDDIDDDLIYEIACSLHPHCTPSTIHRQVRTPITAVLRDARGQKRRKSVDARRTLWLTPEEAERLLEHAGAVRSKIAFLLGSGSRVGEMLAAVADNLNRTTRQCWIEGEEDGAGKTEAASRWVRFPARAWSLMGELPTNGHLFLTPKGVPYQLTKNRGGQIAAAFNKARDAAELSSAITPHVLRHTWATWYYAQTLDFGGLMDLGGWTKAETANRYRKLAPDDLAERLLQFGWDFRHKSGNFLEQGVLRIVK